MGKESQESIGTISYVKRQLFENEAANRVKPSRKLPSAMEWLKTCEKCQLCLQRIFSFREGQQHYLKMMPQMDTRDVLV